MTQDPKTEPTVAQLTEQLKRAESMLLRAEDMLQATAAQRDAALNQVVHLTAEVRALQRQLVAATPPSSEPPPAETADKPAAETATDAAAPVAPQKLNGKGGAIHAVK